MYPTNFCNPAGQQLPYGLFMLPVIPPAGQQRLQPMQHLQQTGQPPYTQYCYPD